MAREIRRPARPRGAELEGALEEAQFALLYGDKEEFSFRKH